MPDEARCPQCGTPYTPTDAPGRCANCGADLPPSLPAAEPKPLGIEGWFQESETPQPTAAAPTPWPPPDAEKPPPLPAAAEEPILLDTPLEPVTPPPAVPTVRRAARLSGAGEPPTARVAPSRRLDDLPEARRTPRREPRGDGLVRPPLPPVRETAPPEVPKPKVFLALFVLLALFVVGACAMTVILYALWAGFHAASKSKAEAPVADVRPV
jgi:hypothetical protein